MVLLCEAAGEHAQELDGAPAGRLAVVAAIPVLGAEVLRDRFGETAAASEADVDSVEATGPAETVFAADFVRQPEQQGAVLRARREE
ncbi:MAG: hypothetical protein ACRDL7_15525 [Gaiellaceae bacterium]